MPMPTRYRQAIVDGACPVCGGRVALKWALPNGADDGFANARCVSEGHGAGEWFAGDYAECPVEDMETPAAAVALLAGRRVERRG